MTAMKGEAVNPREANCNKKFILFSRQKGTFARNSSETF